MSTGFTQGAYDYKNKRFTDFISVGNNSTTETVAYSYNIPAGSFQNNGDTMFAQFFGSASNNGHNKFINLYWGTTSLASSANSGLVDGGDMTFDSQSAWYMSLLIIRSGTSSFRSGTEIIKNDILTNNFLFGVNYQEISGANFTKSNPLILTVSGSATNDMYVHFSNVTFK